MPQKVPRLLTTSLTRRTLLRWGSRTALASLTGPLLTSCANKAKDRVREDDVPLPDPATWEGLDEAIRGWWDGDWKTALEADVAADPKGTLLYLPRPYLTPGGSEAAFGEMYGWDTYFINLGLLAHGRLDLVQNHILNHCYMIEHYGKVLNGNRTYYLGRSQPPLLADTVRQFLGVGGASEVVRQAYPLLQKEYEGYWRADHHKTPAGLSTNRDLLASENTALRPALAAEAETGLDFTAIYGGDVRECAPLLTNCALVRYADALSEIAAVLGDASGAETWRAEAERRAGRIRELCWDEHTGFFLEYNYVTGQRLPYRSVCAYWTLWAGVATHTQASALVAQLGRFEMAHGLSVTDKAYPSPHPEFRNLQWSYPLGWPPLQLVATEGLARYGYELEAKRISSRFVTLMLGQYEKTGKLWEKYNVVTGGLEFPLERYPSVPFHGWSSAAAVALGRRVFG